MPTATPSKSARHRLGLILTFCFVLVMIMGPGPGLLLVNPDPNDPTSPATFLGLPIIYLWGLFWYGLQIAIIAAAYRWVWVEEEEDRPE